MSYLRYLCLFAYSGVQYILCFFILYTLCCQFLWFTPLVLSDVYSIFRLLLLARNAMNVNEYEKLSNMTLGRQFR